MSEPIYNRNEAETLPFRIPGDFLSEAKTKTRTDMRDVQDSGLEVFIGNRWLTCTSRGSLRMRGYWI